jgi:hypothetical protein
MYDIYIYIYTYIFVERDVMLQAVNYTPQNGFEITCTSFFSSPVPS